MKKKLLYVLNYHSVSEEAERSYDSIPYFDLRINPARFESHLKWLQKNFLMVSEEMLLNAEFKNPENKPCCLLTFDDGYKDNYDVVFPLLKKYNLSAVIFIIYNIFTDAYILWDNLFLEITYKLNVDKIKEFFNLYIPEIKKSASKEKCVKLAADFLKYKLNSQAERISIVKQLSKFSHFKIPDRKRYLTLAQCLEMQKSGLVIFGSHTLSHSILSNSIEFDEEINLSKKYLENTLDKPIHSICYPSGGYNQSVIDVCTKAGYKMGFTVENGTNLFPILNNFKINRFHIGNFSKNYLIFELNGWKHKLKKIFS